MAMRPPNSPRETRRSIRRSGPSASSTSSKSPHSPPPDTPFSQKKDTPQQRPVLSSANSSGRNRRFKQEDIEDDQNDKSVQPILPAPTQARSKRKGKEKQKDKHSPDNQKSFQENVNSPGDDPEVDEDASVTRCVCGSTEDDPDAGEFMVQCEKCQVWQHGLCMGYESEDKLNASLPQGASYFCELCSPELHASLLQKLSKKTRHSSITSARNSVSAPSRLSRSHSPTVLSKQPHKRRNTMNSRFEESLQEIIEATAAEAALAEPRAENINGESHEPEEAESTRNKRKRSEEDAPPKKRTRSASTASELPMDSTVGREETPAIAGSSKPTPSTTVRGNGRAKRGGARRPVARPESVDGEQPVPPKRMSNNRSRAGGAKRPASNHANSAAATAAAASVSVHEHGTRRNPTNGGPGAASALEASRAYRSSHAYIVSQQPLHTSWNLPDYLPQLAHMLPSDVPVPLQVRAGGLSGSLDRTAERGVKVKWPSKRMSVGDMNKRVRALSEWIGREQASLLDRGRRREALSKKLKDTMASGAYDSEMVLDVPMTEASPMGEDLPNGLPNGHDHSDASTTIADAVAMDEDDTSRRAKTEKMLSDLMQELIGFQERFAPGMRTRERRMVS